MAISQKLHTKLVQKLILTPSLQQAIKLLPMSTLELSELLNQEMVENPLLEEYRPRSSSRSQATPKRRPRSPEEKPAQEKTDTWDDQDYEYFFGDYLDDGYRPRTPTEVRELPPIENTLSTSASLSDHLLWQLSMQSSDRHDARDRGSCHRQPRRRRLPGGHGRRTGHDGPVADRDRSRPAWRSCNGSTRSAWRRETSRSASCCSCGIWASPARRRRRSSRSTCACCRTTRCPSWPGRSESPSRS